LLSRAKLFVTIGPIETAVISPKLHIQTDQERRRLALIAIVGLMLLLSR
jgi:hypothetical protein